MTNTFQKITQSRFSLIIAFVLAIGIYIASQFIMRPIAEMLINDFQIDFNTRQSTLKIVILILSIAAMLILNKGSLKEFGFTKPKPINYYKLILITVVVVMVTLLAGIIFIVLSHNLSSQAEGINKIDSKETILTTIVTIWFLSSISETILTRGLFQSMLINLKHIRFLKLSLPVILTALLFGLLHATALFAGKSIWFTLFLVFTTSCMGLVAAYYREKSDSIIPAFLVHILANALGSVPQLL